MKLEIPFINMVPVRKEDFLRGFELLKYNPIDNFPWKIVSPKPYVRFKIAHNNQSIFLHYDVWETETRAVYSNHNDPVYKDSCVEFFISFKGSPNYYNFEFNCLGTCLSSWGTDRNDRESLPLILIEQIQTLTSIQRNKSGDSSVINWQLTLRLPSFIFTHDKIRQFHGIKATANFYKCGDDLSQPHFMSWNNIETLTPDFHQPNFFGELIFL